MKTLNLKVDPALHAEFKSVLAKQGKLMSDALRDWMRSVIDAAKGKAK